MSLRSNGYEGFLKTVMPGHVAVRRAAAGESRAAAGESGWRKQLSLLVELYSCWDDLLAKLEGGRAIDRTARDLSRTRGGGGEQLAAEVQLRVWMASGRRQ